METNIKNVAINHIMRNIDKKVSKDEKFQYLYTDIHTEDLVLTTIATQLRNISNTSDQCFEKDMNVLNPLPLSLRSYVMATADNYKLVESYIVDEDEDLHITLKINNCRSFINEILDFICENYHSYFLKLTNENNRNCDFIFMTNL